MKHIQRNNRPAGRCSSRILDGILAAVVITVLAVGISLFARSVTVVAAAGDSSAVASDEKTVDVTFNKVWEGDDDHQGARPSSVTLTVSNANTGAVVKEVTLTAEDNWTATERLPYVKNSEGTLPIPWWSRSSRKPTTTPSRP